MTFAADDHPEARAEYLGAVQYYDQKHPGLGAELINRFEDALADIVNDPSAWPRVAGWDGEVELRSHRVETFHYRIVYLVSGERVQVVAYAHSSREPEYWRTRTDS